MATPAHVMYDGRPVSTATELGKEVLKFEKPYTHQHYPKMLYKASITPGGQVRVCEVQPDTRVNLMDGAALERERERILRFDAGNQLTVRDDDEYKAALNAGWRDNPTDALEHYEARERAIGNAAAERAASDSKMSEKAQAEVAEADQATEFHLPEIPEKPKKRKFFKSKG